MVCWKQGEASSQEATSESPGAFEAVAAGESLAEFVDGRVRSLTGFGSARELLESEPPLPILWICLGAGALLWLALWLRSSAPEAGLLLLPAFLFLGYGVAVAVYGALKARCVARYAGEWDGPVDSDRLLRFLNERLTFLRPCLHEWGYWSYGDAFSIFEEADARDRFRETILCTTFGAKERRVAQLILRPRYSGEGGGSTEYRAAIENAVEGPWIISGDLGFQTYRCAARLAPVLRAVMEYYLAAAEQGRL